MKKIATQIAIVIAAAVVTMMILKASLAWPQVGAASQSDDIRICRPLFIDNVQCGKLCRRSDRWVIKGCQPLNKLMK